MVELTFEDNSNGWQNITKNSNYIVQSKKQNNNTKKTTYRAITHNISSIVLEDYYNYLQLGYKIHKTDYDTCSQICINKNHEIRHDRYWNHEKRIFSRDVQYMLLRFKIPQC